MSPGPLDTLDLLRRNLVFGELSEDVPATVAEHLEPLTLTGGSMLFATGAPSDALYVMRWGSMGIFRPPRAGGAPHLSGVQGSGETVGSVDLLLDQPREVAARVFTPPLDDIGLLDFDDFDRAVEAGFRHALDALSEPLG